MDTLKSILGAITGTIIGVLLASVLVLLINDSESDKVAATSGAKQPDDTFEFTLCNKSTEDIYSSIGYVGKTKKGAVGWLSLPTSECITIAFGHEYDYYIHGTGSRGSNWGATHTFCTSSKESFEIKETENCQHMGHDTSRFDRLEVKADEKHVAFDFTGGKPAKIDGLDVGDGVYVRGFFADELAVISRIDKTNNTVKVNRSLDGTTKWMSVNDIFTREESQIQDIKRATMAIDIIGCILNSDLCSK